MARLLRPYVPRDVRCRVLLRQLGELWPDQCIEAAAKSGSLGHFVNGLKNRLAEALACKPEDLRLDHDPALENRRKRFTPRGPFEYVYEPDANDPEFLIYREKHAHHIKTNVRGDGAQYPDRVLAKRERRRRKKLLGDKVQRALVKSGPKMSMRQTGAIKKRWAKRRLKSANRWPKGRRFWRG